MQSDPLQQLRALHTPEPPGWWPPAPGWWVLAALLLVALGLLARIALDLRRALAPHRQAQAEHRRLRAELDAGTIDGAVYLNQGSALLKRVLLFVLEDPAAAASSGTDWLTQLDQLTNGTGFSSGPGRLLASARFAAEPPPVPAGLPLLIDQALDAARHETLRRWLDRWLPGYTRRRNGEAGA